MYIAGAGNIGKSLAKKINNELKTIGYVHSFPVGLPTNCLSREGSPEKLIINGNDQYYCFKKYLNWRFDSIHGETFFQKNNCRMFKIFAWELTPQKGQLYYKSSKNKRLHKNWLVAKLNLPVSKTKDKALSALSDLL